MSAHLPLPMGRFRYALAPLLQLRQFQLDVLKMEMASATRLMNERERMVHMVRQRIAGALQALSGQRANGAMLDLDKEQFLRRYLAHLDEHLAACMKDWQDARRLHDSISANLRQALQAARGLESHMADQQKAHAAGQEAALSQAADEAWLMAGHWKGTPA